MYIRFVESVCPIDSRAMGDLFQEVATLFQRWWQPGKGPIDVYSCFQKNIKSVHGRLGPLGAIWLRLIMTCVYNAYHTYNPSQTVEYLISDKCKSFKDFQKR